MTVDICDASLSLLTAQSGYISTPRYPNNYPNDADCNLVIKTDFDDQRIRLYAIDVNLEPNGTGCADWLLVQDGYRSKTTCSPVARQLFLTSHSHSLEINFHSNQANRSKGFWLYYEGENRTVILYNRMLYIC